MKKFLNSYGIIMVTILLISAGCNRQGSRSNLQDNITEIREEMLDVVGTIDEALVADNLSDFKNRAEDALSNLQDQIDSYENEMDKADLRMSAEIRDKVVNLKHRKAEVELKLDLLDRDGFVGDHHFLNYSDTIRTSRNASGTAINPHEENLRDTRYGLGRELDEPRDGHYPRDEQGREIRGNGHMTQHDHLANQHLQQDTAFQGEPAQRGVLDRPATDNTNVAIDRPATDHTATEAERIRAETNEPYYGPEILTEIINDLRELQSEIEDFVQSDLLDID
jgi:hypothetical protein